MALQSINPGNGELIREYAEAREAEVASILAEADRAFGDWRRASFAERARPLRRAAELLEARREDLARTMALEMGKPLAQGRAEADKCASVCRYYADGAEGFLAREEIRTEATKSFVTFTPLGVVLAVMPWNFPLWQVFRFAAPALMAGNAGLLKHASNVTGSALAIESIFHDAGLPPALFRTLLLSSSRVSAVIESPVVKAVTLTGSTPAGQAVAARAGALLKKTVLELGGSDPYVILADADLDAAVEACVASRLINGGQSCIAAKRFIVVEPVQQAFEDKFVEAMRRKKVGDAFDPATDVGPQARRDLRDDLHRQVAASVAKGARLRLGGVVPDGPGAFYPPTVLVDVRKGMPAYDEELFGPVAALIAAKDEADAIRLANDRRRTLRAASGWRPRPSRPGAVSSTRSSVRIRDCRSVGSRNRAMAGSCRTSASASSSTSRPST